jgi:hypothetical protein
MSTVAPCRRGKKAFAAGLSLGILLLLAAGCGDSLPTSPGPEDAGPSVTVEEDVESLIGGAMAGWWRAVHGFGPGPALSVAADAHASSWMNWGMFHAGQEPRQDLSSLESQLVQYLSDRPWLELYRTLAATRDGLRAMSGGLELGDEQATLRAQAFARFMQGLALGTLAQLFEEAWILDEHADPGSAELSPYSEVLDAALAKLDLAESLAAQGDFTIPADWVAFHRALDQDDFGRLVRSWRARIRMSVARTPDEAAAVDWAAVLDDARDGIVEDWAGYFDGNHEENWAWSVLKRVSGNPLWVRMDYRTVGPADASGAWEEWIASDPAERWPFPIDTDDRRITGGSPTSDGLYVGYNQNIPFLLERGSHHFSYYMLTRWSHLWGSPEGAYVDFPVKELGFIEAEALLRHGDAAGAMAILNESRTKGELPPFTDPAQPAPGGDRCVPRGPDGSCGDLWDALRYEKRIETLHYGPFTEYVDARRWGTLLPGTFRHLERPDVSLPEVLAEIYGVESAAVAVQLANGTTDADLSQKREAVGSFDRERNLDPRELGAG